MKEKTKASWVIPLQLGDRSFGQVELAIVDKLIFGAVADRKSKVERINRDLSILPGTKCAVCITIDGGAEDTAAFLLGEGRYVSSAASEADS